MINDWPLILSGFCFVKTSYPFFLHYKYFSYIRIDNSSNKGEDSPPTIFAK